QQGLLDESLHYGMDFDLLIKTALNYRISGIHDILSKYRLHDKSKSVTHLKHFLSDWQKTFSKFLRTIPSTEKFVSRLKKIGLYNEGKDYYQSPRTFTDVEIKKIVTYFLQSQAHVYYHILDVDMVKKIADLMKQISPESYRSVSKINFRA